MTELRTDRLLLRSWCDADRDPFAALNADPAVMRYFPAPLCRADSDALVDRIQTHLDEHGYGLWAVEDAEGFCGFTGLAWQRFPADFTPALEVGWRLARRAWGRGYATEAGTAALAYGLQVEESIISMTAALNSPSERVMQRIGMRWERVFDHPNVPAGHRLQPHVLYRADRRCWPTN